MNAWQFLVVALCIVVATMFTYCMGFKTGRTGGYCDGYADGRYTLLSTWEIQEVLNAIEPNGPITVDGVIGPATLAKWERLQANIEAEKYMTPTGAPLPETH